MNNRPMVSIITPSYNQGEFIEDTILSIKGQTYENFEHILVDAGSTDNTLGIIRKYEGTYNLTWSSESDEGMYHGINKGLKKAHGEILCYLNSDDLYLPWTLEVVVDYFIKNKQVDLVYGDIIFLENKKKSLELTFCPPFNHKWVQLSGGLYQPAVFWRRHIYERAGGFDESLKFVGDYDYWLRVAALGTVRKVNEFLAVDRLQYKAKRFVNRDLLEMELACVGDRYSAPPKQKTLLKFFYRFYSYFWTRSYMFLFITQHANRGNRSRRFWPHLLDIADLQIPSIRSLILRFPPYVGKRNPWLVSNLPLPEAKAFRQAIRVKAE